jgi:hypothetical protein
LNCIPEAKHTAKNADTLVNEVCDAGELWTVLAKPSKSGTVLFTRLLLPAKPEVENNPAKCRLSLRAFERARILNQLGDGFFGFCFAFEAVCFPMLHEQG